MIVPYPTLHCFARVSCCIVEGTPMLDLDYTEDFTASTDLAPADQP
jgi:ribonuclease PH